MKKFEMWHVMGHKPTGNVVTVDDKGVIVSQIGDDELIGEAIAFKQSTDDVMARAGNIGFKPVEDKEPKDDAEEGSETDLDKALDTARTTIHPRRPGDIVRKAIEAEAEIEFTGSVVETYALKRQASPASPSWTVDGVQYATRKAANRALATMLGNYTPEEWEAAQHAHGLHVGEPEGATTNPWPTGSTAQALSEPAVAVYDPSVDTLGFYPAGGAGHLELQVELSTSQRAIYQDEMPMALLVGAVRFESGFNVVMTPSAGDRTLLVSLGAASACARLWDDWTRLAVPRFEVIRFEANWRVTFAALPGDDGLEELLARARANNRRRRQRPQPGES